MKTKTKRGSRLRPLDASQQALALSALRLARSLARRFAAAYRLDAEKAENVAVDRLLHAVARYEARDGAKFSTFARKCITRALISLAIAKGRQTGKRCWLLTNILGRASEREDEASSFEPIDQREVPPAEQAELQDVCSRVASVLQPHVWRILWSYFAEGHTLQEIGQTIGLTNQRISQLLVEGIAQARAGLPGLVEGEPVPPQRCKPCAAGKPRCAARVAEMQRLRDEGMTYREIARRFGCYPGNVWQVLQAEKRRQQRTA